MNVKILECRGNTELDSVKKIRKAFAVVGDDIYFQADGDNRPMHVALADELGVTDKVLGGYVDTSSMVFFKRNGHSYPDLENITKTIIFAVRGCMDTEYDVAVWAGVAKGKPGELWPPKRLIGRITADGRYTNLLEVK